MSASLGPMLALCLWLGLSLVVGAASTQLSFAWIERVSATGLPARLRRLAVAGLSLGTGIWAVHGLSVSVHSGGMLGAHSPLAELAVWLAAVVASMAALDRSASAPVRTPQWLVAPLGLGSVIVVLQMHGMWSGDTPWATESRLGLIAVAWLCCVAGSLLAFRIFLRFRRRSRHMVARGRASAGLILGAAMVLSQHVVMLSEGGLPSQQMPADGAQFSGAALATSIFLGAGGLLLALLAWLSLQLRAQTASVKARRMEGIKLLNDPLTGLPNRTLFEGTLAQAVRNADESNRSLALLLINLDGFRPINQTFGHRGGDQVLREMASRLRALSGPHMAARLASDEFLVLQTENPRVEDASSLAAKVLASIGQPLDIEGRAAAISCSIGVAMYPEHGAMSTLVRHAEAAMRTAKSSGGASHAFFEARMLNSASDDVVLLRDLRLALKRCQLELFYQPKIHAPSGEVTGAEALIRWNHPQRGMIPPGVFIPIAERYGLINELGRWVIDEACRQIRAWRDAGLRMRVAINLSVHQLRQAELAERIQEALQRHQINPDLITCELTESAAMDDTECTMRVLGQLDKVGVHISIDDFGTGHSSLSYLGKLPADELKIDRNFVLDLETSEDARKVASAIINLAKSLGLKVVAEGVETEGQNRILREYGCDQLQGYLFARPMSAKALSIWAIEDVGPRTLNFRSSLFKESGQIAKG